MKASVVHTGECYSAVERNEWLIQATKWSNLEKAAQSDRSHKGDSV